MGTGYSFFVFFPCLICVHPWLLFLPWMGGGSQAGDFFLGLGGPRQSCTSSTGAILKVRAASASAAKPQTVRVAGIVLKWLPTEKEANFRRIVPLIREAAARGAKIVCTTECFLDGYAIADKSIPLETYRALGEPIPHGPFCRKLCTLAAELKICLVAGMLEADGDARYNTAAIIGPDGKLVGKYRKQQLEHEAVRNTPGKESPVFATSLAKIGVIICADRRFPEVVKPICERGAEVLLCPSGGMFGPKSNDPILQNRSRENRKYIVFVHPAEFLVTGPDGAILQRAIVGDKLAISRGEVGTRADGKKVFYFDLPLFTTASSCKNLLQTPLGMDHWIQVQ
jgi:predicted amidohydrolase